MQPQQQIHIIEQPQQVGAIMANTNTTTPAAGELKLTQATIVGCDGMLERLKHEESTIDLGASLAPLFLKGEKFLPASIYVRKEMCQVFEELTKKERKRKQILIGSPGVGKSILLFLVALYRALTESKPCCFIRKTRDSEELTSVFVFVDNTSAQDGTLIVYHNRSVSPSKSAENILEQILSRLFQIPSDEALQLVINDQLLLFLDGLHQGDDDLIIPHHCLSTSGGYDTPQGESSISTSLVVLGGWQKEALFKGLKIVASRVDIPLMGTNETETEDDGSQLIDDIFYHTGGRIREALQYSKNRVLWKKENKDMIDKIPRDKAVLSIVETKGSADPKSTDRIRTMFRKEDGIYFGSAVQIVDSQYYARLLRDRVGLEDYFNAYKHAMERGLSSAAGCHFEELLHHLFRKRPNPITQVLQSVGKGAEGVRQLQDYSVYWIPSIPNFASIDAAIVMKDGQCSVTIWCLKYTVSSNHAFNSKTFRTKFLRQVLSNFKLDADATSVKILFVVPHDVYSNFKLPEEVENAGFEGATTFVDCSNVDALESCLAHFDFVEKPLTFFDEVPTAKRAGAFR